MGFFLELLEGKLRVEPNGKCEKKWQGMDTKFFDINFCLINFLKII